MKLRFTSDVLRKSLHNTDEYGRLTPKKLKRYEIKNILMQYHETQAVLHHLVFTPEPLDNTGTIKVNTV